MSAQPTDIKVYAVGANMVGYVELEKLSAALAEYVSSPESVRTFVSTLLNAEASR